LTCAVMAKATGLSMGTICSMHSVVTWSDCFINSNVRSLWSARRAVDKRLWLAGHATPTGFA
jgi:hypothetical protein